MSFLNSIKDLLGGAAGDVIGGLPELGGITEQVTSATEAIAPVVEQGKTAVDDITQNLGL